VTTAKTKSKSEQRCMQTVNMVGKPLAHGFQCRPRLENEFMAMDGRPFSSPMGSFILAVKIPCPYGRARPCIRRGREAPGMQMWTIRVVPVPLLTHTDSDRTLWLHARCSVSVQSSPIQAAVVRARPGYSVSSACDGLTVRPPGRHGRQQAS
jgi:hypothetical protein